MAELRKAKIVTRLSRQEKKSFFICTYIYIYEMFWWVELVLVFFIIILFYFDSNTINKELFIYNINIRDQYLNWIEIAREKVRRKMNVCACVYSFSCANLHICTKGGDRCILGCILLEYFCTWFARH